MKRIAIFSLFFLVGCGNVVREEIASGSTSSSGASSGGGACQRDCKGQPCVDGLCGPELLVSDLYFPNRLGLDSSAAYWTSAEGTVNAFLLANENVKELVSGQDDPMDIAVDASGAYFTDCGSNTIHSVPLGGGALTLLAETGNPLGIVVRGKTVFITNTYDKLSNDEQVVAVPLPAGPASVVSTSLGAYMLAVDDKRVVWTDRASGSVWSAPLLGGEKTLLAGGLQEPLEIEMDAEAAYVTTLEATYKIPLAGGAPEALVGGAGRGLAMDDLFIYVGTADGRIVKTAKTGGGTIELSKTELFPSDLAVDGEHVYWITRSESGMLWRTAK